MELDRFSQQLNGYAALVTAEILVQNVAELLPLGQLTAVDNQVALQHVDQAFPHLLSHLLGRLVFFILVVLVNAGRRRVALVIRGQLVLNVDFAYIEVKEHFLLLRIGAAWLYELLVGLAALFTAAPQPRVDRCH